jgi:2,3-bisphosphoglycerate-dependent phosphoglycerate mutase
MPELILLRHGQSIWNLENLFTGWHDVGLTAQGEEEARNAGRQMMADGIRPAVLHTSLLRRAISTANLTLEEMDRGWIPVRRDWRLNERHYGALQGLNKKETADLHGSDAVFAWRRSYDTPPPALDIADPRHPSHDTRYDGVAADILPAAECLQDVVMRVLPYWYDAIVSDLKSDMTVLVVAHGNSLRALVKHLEGVSDEEISVLNIPTGIPRRYVLDHDMQLVSVAYLGDAEEATAAAAAVANQAK